MTVSSLYKNTTTSESSRFSGRGGRKSKQVEVDPGQLQGKRQQRSSIVCKLGTVNLNDV